MNFLDSFMLFVTGSIALVAVITILHWAFFAVKDNIKSIKNKRGN